VGWPSRRERPWALGGLDEPAEVVRAEDGTVSTRARLVDELAALVGCESGSTDLAALETCAGLVDDVGAGWVGRSAERHMVEGRTHLRWRFGATRVLLLGHYDTVWPTGTLAGWPFAVDGDRATGPGIFDMKAGIIQLFAALGDRDDLDGVSVLLTADEELGSPSSRSLIEDTARDAEAALVLEPSAGGALKLARKGVSLYTVRTLGRAAHAGLEPERGVNAGLELAHQLIAIAGLGRAEVGTTVTPTVLAGGTTSNTVPAAATVAVDVRATSEGEQQRVDSALRALAPVLTGAGVEVSGGPNRPPLEANASSALFALAGEVAHALGMGPLEGVAVGGGSDGNFTAGLGVPTLDGLGAVGDHAHAEGEWVSVDAMVARSALVGELVARLLR